MTLLRWIGLIGSLLLVLGAPPVAAQSSADAFFHDAAQQYVTGDQEAARRAVKQGLKVAPWDPRLLALKKKLRRQDRNRRPRGGGQSSRQGSQNRQQRQQSRGENAQEQQSGESGQEPRSQANAPSDSRSSQRKGAQSDQTRQHAQGHGSQKTPDGDRRRMNALSRAQAARILQALENQEMKLLREVQARSQKTTTVEKDW